MRESRWLTPIYHPNISEIGMVCLGGYGTHWVPSLNLDELCGMLWTMARSPNHDIRRPYNREAALWVANQSTFRFPIDSRPLRALRAALGRVAVEPPAPPAAPKTEPAPAAAQGNAKETESGRYHEFIRKFAASLHPEAPRISSETNESEGLILLDIEVELRPAPVQPRPGPNDEIVFIE